MKKKRTLSDMLRKPISATTVKNVNSTDLHGKAFAAYRKKRRAELAQQTSIDSLIHEIKVSWGMEA